jgi:hypothetical protein
VLALEETLDAERSFTFPFEDQEWPNKLGLGAVISSVPILNFAWTGYMLGILRNVMNNAPEPLPTWDDLDRKFSDGLLLFAAGVVYALPVLIALFLPLSIAAYSILVSGNSNLQDIGRVITGAGGVLFYGLVCGLVLYGVGLSIIYPAILVVYAREGTFVSCFKLGQAFKMVSRNIAPFFTAWGLSVAAGLAVGLIVGFINLVVGWVPCLGWIIGLALSLGSGVYLATVYAHLFGRFGRIAFGQNQLAPIT